MIKKMLSSFWFWGFMLVAFIAIILWDDDSDEGVKTAYIKAQMTLNHVNFSQIENGFESARMYAENCTIDDSQTNMDADDMKVLFFKENVATYTGRLIAASATKNPFEAKFLGNVRFWDTDNLRMRTEEMRYLFNRKELTTQKPITIYKDNAVLTGLGMTYNTQTQEAVINQQVVIRLWEDKQKENKKQEVIDKDPISGLPVANVPIEQLIRPMNVNASNTQGISSETVKIEADRATIASNTSNAMVPDRGLPPRDHLPPMGFDTRDRIGSGSQRIPHGRPGMGSFTRRLPPGIGSDTRMIPHERPGMGSFTRRLPPGMASKIPTRKPSRASLAASIEVTKDLPTPPLPLQTPITFLTEDLSLSFSNVISGAEFVLSPFAEGQLLCDVQVALDGHESQDDIINRLQ